MKKLLLAALVSSISLGAIGQEVIDKSIKQLVCDRIEYSLSEAGLRVTYKTVWKEVTVLPEFHKTCVDSISINIDTATMNDRANAFSEMSISYQMEMPEIVSIEGEAKLSRNLFNPQTGEVRIGVFAVKMMDQNFAMGPIGVKSLANALLYSADVHNGGGELGAFDLSDFDVEAEMARRTAAQDSGESCRMYDVERGSVSDFRYLERSHRGYFQEILSFLKKQGHILQILSSENYDEDYDEYCAFNNIFVYLSNGVVIELYYDQTT